MVDVPLNAYVDKIVATCKPIIEKGGADMLNTEDIRNKEVINIYDGRSMGFVCDIEINLKEGRIDGIVLPEQEGYYGTEKRTRR